jgi:hypothetical protein
LLPLQAERLELLAVETAEMVLQAVAQAQGAVAADQPTQAQAAGAATAEVSAQEVVAALLELMASETPAQVEVAGRATLSLSLTKPYEAHCTY